MLLVREVAIVGPQCAPSSEILQSPNEGSWRKPASLLGFSVKRPFQNHLTESLDRQHFNSYSERTLLIGHMSFRRGSAEAHEPEAMAGPQSQRLRSASYGAPPDQGEPRVPQPGLFSFWNG